MLMGIRYFTINWNDLLYIYVSSIVTTQRYIKTLNATQNFIFIFILWGTSLASNSQCLIILNNFVRIMCRHVAHLTSN